MAGWRHALGLQHADYLEVDAADAHGLANRVGAREQTVGRVGAEVDHQSTGGVLLLREETPFLHREPLDRFQGRPAAIDHRVPGVGAGHQREAIGVDRAHGDDVWQALHRLKILWSQGGLARARVDAAGRRRGVPDIDQRGAAQHGSRGDLRGLAERVDEQQAGHADQDADKGQGSAYLVTGQGAQR